MTASASFTASSVDPARTQPPSTACASASSLRSNARTSCPAFTRFGAIPPPMWPKPINAIFAMLAPRSPAKAGSSPKQERRSSAAWAPAFAGEQSISPSTAPAASRRRRSCLLSGPRCRTGRGTACARSGCPGRAGCSKAALTISLTAMAASGGIAAIASAVLSASSSSSAAGTTLATRPERSASAASIIRPVRHISIALALPIAQVRRCEPPMPGVTPSLISGWPNFALSAAMMKSAIIATSQPPPSA